MTDEALEAYAGPSWQEGAYVVDVVLLEEDGVLAAGLVDGRVSFRLLDKPEMEVGAPVLACAQGLAVLAAHPEGGAVLAAGEDGRVVRVSKTGDVTVLHSEAGARYEQLAVHESGAFAAAFKKTVLLFGADGGLKARFENHPSTVQGLCFDPKGKRLVAAHYNGLSLWWVNGEAGQEPQRLVWKGSHLGVAFSPNGRYLLSSLQENALHGWRLPDFADFQMSGYVQKPKSFGWDSSGRWLASSGSMGIVCWDCGGKGPMGRPAHVLAADMEEITARVAPHPELPLVAAATLSGRVLLARFEDERIVWLRTKALEGEGDEVTALRWSPSGRTLAAATESGRCYTWAFAE